MSQGLENHETARMSFLTLDWERAPISRNDYKEFEELPDKPINLNKMIEISKTLSKNIPFVRVDLYEINNRVYFSELTFSPCGGFVPFSTYKQDLYVGEMLDLNIHE